MSYPIGISPLFLLDLLYEEGAIRQTSSDASVRYALDVRGFRDAGYVRRVLDYHGLVRYEGETGNPF